MTSKAASDKAGRIRRMWSEVSGERIPEPVAARLAEALEAERLPEPRTGHKAAVLAAVLAKAAERREAIGPRDERAFRRVLDQGTPLMGTWRLLDAVRPHFGLLSWSYWATAAALLVLGAFVLPGAAAWGPGALIVTVPAIALVSLVYTVRAGSRGMQEWERSCPVTPLQIALARATLVLGIAVAAALIGSVALLRQEAGVSLSALTVSWFAPLLLIVGLYMACDVLIGGMAGPAGGAAGWFVHLLVTRGGRALSTVAAGAPGTGLSAFDAFTLSAGALLLALSMYRAAKVSEASHADRAR